jgi:nifR3 family TIM-barrel protein
MVVTEMVSARGLMHHNARTAEYLSFHEQERPIALQLFGDEPDAMATATELALTRPQIPDVLDINMGCPVRKVVKTGAGSALLADPPKATAVAAAVVKVASEHEVPVTVKLRSGLRPGDGMAVDLAPALESVGVAALGVHPRAASEYYRGLADHSVTAAVVRAVKIPVMLSGDISEVGRVVAVVEETGATAVMVARGAAGNPWLVDGLLAGREVARPALPEVVADLRKLIQLVAEERGEERASRWIRKLLTWYLRPAGVPAPIIQTMRGLGSVAEVDAVLKSL